MPFSQSILLVITAAVLIVILYTMVRRRIDGELKEQRRDQKERWAGRDIELPKLSSRTEELRRRHAGVVQTSRQDPRHGEFIARSTRRAAKLLSCFQEDSKADSQAGCESRP